MNFNDAVNNMIAGKRLMRPHWVGYYTYILPNQSYIWTVSNSNDKPTVTANVYIASIEDILADDWILKIN